MARRTEDHPLQYSTFEGVDETWLLIKRESS
jgi:hypothetical protein